MSTKAMQPDAVRTWTFTLTLSGVGALTGEVEDMLFEAGCDDALVGTRDGVVYLDFDREALSLREAILSAIADVEEAGVAARVTRVERDTGSQDLDVGRCVAAINAVLDVRRHVCSADEARRLFEALLVPRDRAADIPE